MKKLCLLLSALLALAAAVPVLAEDINAEMAYLLLGDWTHESDSEHYLLFDGANQFYYATDSSFYYGIYTYTGGGEYLLLDDVGEEHVLSIYDDMTLGLDGVDGYFSCQYRYLLMDFPATDAGMWLHDDGVTTISFSLDGDFELDFEDAYYFGECTYDGNGEYRLEDEDGMVFIASLYDNNSIGLAGVDGYFWLQPQSDGDNPFEFVEDDAEFFEEMLRVVTVYDNDPIPLAGTWYKYGDPDSLPFILEENTYICEHSVFGYESRGTWTLDESVLSLTDEETDPAAYISMESEDGMPSGWNPFLMAGNRLLYASAQDVYFLHESLVGTQEGTQLCRMADFMRANWFSQYGDDTLMLKFSCMNGVIICTTFGEDGSYQEIVGTWSLEDNCIVAAYTDESTARYELPAETITAAGLEFMQ